MVLFECFREDLAAVTEPDQIPIVTVGRDVGPEGLWLKKACPVGDELELGLEAYVPVYVVFKDKGRGKALLDDAWVLSMEVIEEREHVFTFVWHSYAPSNSPDCFPITSFYPLRMVMLYPARSLHGRH